MPDPRPATVGSDPPYHVVVFVSHRADDGDPAYHDTFERLVELVSAQPGFLAYDTARGPNGLGVTVCYFAGTAAIEEWRTHPEHLLAQRAGRERWYTAYALHIGQIHRSYRHDPGDRPQPTEERP